MNFAVKSDLPQSGGCAEVIKWVRGWMCTDTFREKTQTSTLMIIHHVLCNFVDILSSLGHFVSVKWGTGSKKSEENIVYSSYCHLETKQKKPRDITWIYAVMKVKCTHHHTPFVALKFHMMWCKECIYQVLWSYYCDKLEVKLYR